MMFDGLTLLAWFAGLTFLALTVWAAPYMGKR